MCHTTGRTRGRWDQVEGLSDAPILWQRHGPGSFGALGVVFDRAGNTYATTFEHDAAERTRLFALGARETPRWSLTLAPSRGVTSIALGADANVVVVHCNEVLAVE